MRNTTDSTAPTAQRAARKLVLARETLRTLTSDELRLAAGGGQPRPGASNSGGYSCYQGGDEGGC